mmetsp:Transcript_83294/g.248514  ORF Transcript_83294/g.248514 Transcript_83294/m.248514 type:complete len:204 (-) Transcript_83294:179-790(-)
MRALSEKTSPALATLCGGSSPRLAGANSPTLGAKCTESCLRPDWASEDPKVGSSCISTGDSSPKSSFWLGHGSSRRESAASEKAPRERVFSPGHCRRAASCSQCSSPEQSVSSRRNCSRACQRSWAETLSIAMSMAHRNSSLPTPAPFASRSISRPSGSARLLSLASIRSVQALREISPTATIVDMKPKTAHRTKPRVRPRLS